MKKFPENLFAKQGDVCHGWYGYPEGIDCHGWHGNEHSLKGKSFEVGALAGLDLANEWDDRGDYISEESHLVNEDGSATIIELEFERDEDRRVNLLSHTYTTILTGRWKLQHHPFENDFGGRRIVAVDEGHWDVDPITALLDSHEIRRDVVTRVDLIVHEEVSIVRCCSHLTYQGVSDEGSYAIYDGVLKTLKAPILVGMSVNADHSTCEAEAGQYEVSGGTFIIRWICQVTWDKKWSSDLCEIVLTPEADEEQVIELLKAGFSEQAPQFA